MIKNSVSGKIFDKIYKLLRHLSGKIHMIHMYFVTFISVIDMIHMIHMSSAPPMLVTSFLTLV